ncbi:hypothetical protein HDU86_008237 [Geranomyces michiganensis]|nr:hypothetical protein HDU86_008237 [Geranomyces michiganensis]
MAEPQDDLIDYDSDEAETTALTTNGKDSLAPPTADGDKETKKGSYVGIHATGFRDFLLKPELLRAIVDCGFEHPSEVQQECIPQAILGMDVLCQAKSGMGKTAVFVLASLQQLESANTSGEPAVIVLCHTRELAYQIRNEFTRFSKYMPETKTAVFYGGSQVKANVETLKTDKPQIIVGTPGRILGLIRDKHLKLNNIKHFILDECDKMLEALDMRRDVQEIFRSTPHHKQVMMYSATLSKDMRPICKKFMQNPLEIYVDDETKLTLHGLQQYFVKLSENEKNRKLNELLDSLEFNQVCIFVKSVSRATELNKLLNECNFPSITIHSQMPQEERIARYKSFKEFNKRIMVATDIFGRGIDIERVNIVINYDMPDSPDSYLHRVGRAGRFGTKGLAVTFSSSDTDASTLNDVQGRFEVNITELPEKIDVSTYTSKTGSEAHWYSRLNPVFLDVVGDYAGTELSVVDGDAVLAVVLRRLANLPSLTLLRAVYEVELFLNQLLTAKSIFELVFFTERRSANDSLRLDGSQRSRKQGAWQRLFRTTVIAHLQSNKHVVVHVFDSVHSDAWITYLETSKPMYILTDDGSGVDVKGASPELHAFRRACRRMWLESAWLHLHLGLSIALISDDMFTDNKIVTFVSRSAKFIVESQDRPFHAKALEEALVQLDTTFTPMPTPCEAIIARDSVVVSVLCGVYNKLTPLQVDLAKVFVLHGAILPLTSLELRAQPDANFLLVQECASEVDQFLELFYATAASIDASMTPALIELVDERFFYSLLSAVCKALIADSPNSVRSAMGLGDATGDAENAWATICKDGDFWSFPAFEKQVTKAAVSDSAITRPNQKPQPLLPYAQPFVETYLPKVTELPADEHTTGFPGDYIPIYETSRWNVAKPVPVIAPPPKNQLPTLASRFPPKPQRLAGKGRKQEQRQASFIQKYALSLTGAGGKLIKPKIIVVQPKSDRPSARPVRSSSAATSDEDTSSPKSKGKGKSGSAGGKKVSAPSKKDAIIAANVERLAIAEKEILSKRFAILREKVEKYDNFDLAIYEINRSLADEKSVSSKGLLEEQKLLLVMFLLKKWATFCVSDVNPDDPASPERKEEGIEVLVKIFLLCTGMITSPHSSKAVIQEAQKVLKKVGLEQAGAASTVPEKPNKADRKKEKEVKKSEKAEKSEKDKKEKKTKGSTKADKKDAKEAEKSVSENDPELSFKFSYPRGLPTPSSLHSPHNLTTFQLLYCGAHMDKSMGESLSDPRVDFKPDEWQRKTLDAIDREDSVFVVAPTSAGKTFIAYYAIEKVLRESDSGVIVYVAPTKALVNQIAAEISARFSKSYQYAGVNVWAVHTRDYKIHEPTRSQILVTVPHILQQLMLQPDTASLWAPRLKTIIFDEIHTVAKMSEGVIWEQNLMLCPCPIIALSATVGNPDEFAQWLQDLSAAKGHRLEMIRHAHRFSDLRKFVYAPTKHETFKGLVSSIRNTTSLVHLHPITALASGATTIPDDMHLESHECLMLYEAMHFERTEEAKLDETLNPESYFGKVSVIKKADIIAYQAELKSVLLQWMALPDARTTGSFARVLKRLSKEVDSALAKATQLYESKAHSAPIDLDYALENVTALCADLHRNGKLPAILFNYSHDHVEALGQRLFDDLESAEAEYKTTDVQWKRKVEAWEAWKISEVRRKAAMEKTRNASARGEDDEPQDDGGDAGWQMSFDPTAPLQQYTFTGKSNMSAYEIDKDINSLQWYGVPPKLCQALRRGVGVHHAGMNLRYRQTVERYFRAGFLRVVVATGTLALGINMPAATSVFTEDSLYLTALEYRQASGRAGRRGFDLMGNVLFFAMPLDKVYRLLSSRLPDLSGHFPLSTTLVLRLHQLIMESKSKQLGEKMFRSIFALNTISLGCQANKNEVLYQLRFSIEYLRRAGLLAEGGLPVHLSNLTQYMYYSEPMNLHFAYLLNSGVLNKVVCKAKDPEVALLHCLSHLFCRRRMPAVLREIKHDSIKGSLFKVFLEPLPQEIRDVLRSHDELVLSVVDSFVKNFVQTLEPETTVQLPLTGKSFTKSGPASSGFAKTLATTALKYEARSPFVAISGYDDAFSSVDELVRTCRPGVTLQSTVAPLVSELLDENVVLDAYILDFYNHGLFSILVEANGIEKGNVWPMLYEFRVVLTNIRTVLEVLLKAHKKAELQKLDQAEEEEEEEDEVDENLEDNEKEDEDDDKGNLEQTRRWAPPLTIEAHLRDRRIWDIYQVLCTVQKTFDEKMQAQAA